MIKDLYEGERITIQTLIGNVSRGVNATGSPYLNVELRDSSGIIPGKKWEINGEDNDLFVTGNIVEITCEVIKYRDSLQTKILSARKLNIEEVDVSKFLKVPPVSKEKLTERFNDLVKSIKNDDCRAFLDYFINKFGQTFFDSPAAASVHHEFSSGLLMHSVCVAELCDHIANTYPDVNRDLLVTGALLHDMGKMIELEGPAVFHYTLEGKLIGHISIMSQELAKANEILQIKSEVPTLLEHMILSHHGQHEFGSPVLPLTREALILSIVDSLDSKMLILDKAYEAVKPGEFTQKIFPLDNRTFYKAK